MKQLDVQAVGKALLDLLKQQPTGITNLEIKNLLRMRGYHATQDAVAHHTAMICNGAQNLEFTFNGEYRTYRAVANNAVGKFLRAIGFTGPAAIPLRESKAPIAETVKRTVKKAKKKKKKEKTYLCWSLKDVDVGVRLSAPSRDNARKQFKALTGTDYFDCRARVAK